MGPRPGGRGEANHELYKSGYHQLQWGRAPEGAERRRQTSMR